MLGFHFQRPVTNWTAAVALLPDGAWVKSIDNVQLLAEAKSVNPGIRTVLRHWYDPDQVFGGTVELNRQRARVFFSTFVDDTFRSLAQHVDAVEEWNEYTANSHNQQEIADRQRWVEAVNYVWTNEYRNQSDYAHIRLVSVNAAIGNDIPWRHAQVVAQHGGILGYHNYVLVNDGVIHPDNGQWLSGRWRYMDDEYRNHGVHVNWLFTEGGAYRDVLSGWRSSSVYGAHALSYIDGAISYALDQMIYFNSDSNGRALGGVLFTTDSLSGTWKWYHIQQPEMGQIAQFIRDYVPDDPPDPPPPPPPPPPDPDPALLDNGSFEDGWYHYNGIPELQIPNGWQFDYDDQTPNPYDSNPWSQYVRPEVRVLPADQLPPEERELFIRDGFYTLKPFKGNGTWWAFFTQTVFGLPAGSYRLHLPVFGDLVKDYAPDGSKIWADDPEQRDGQYRIILGDGAVGDWKPIIPGEWNEIEHTFAHNGGSLLVGLEVRCNFALENSGLFCDMWSLQEVSGDCRGAPRIQYRRVFNVLPADANLNRVKEIVEIAFENKETVGFSYDDAGIGDLDRRFAVLWDIPEYQHQEFREWYDEHYPGVTVIFRV